MTEPIVGLPLDRILQGVVRLLYHGELGGRARVVVPVRVILLDPFAERVANFVLRSVGGNAEQLVEIRHGGGVTEAKEPQAYNCNVSQMSEISK